MVSGLAHEIKVPDGIDLSMEFLLHEFAPFHKLQADTGHDRHEYRAYSRPYRHDFERITKAFAGVSTGCRRQVRVLWGYRSESYEGGWTRYVVIERCEGLTFAHMRQIAQEFGIGLEGYSAAVPGQRYANNGYMKRKSRTRVVFVQSGGWDI